jgi:hypothetical protein
MSKKLIDSYAKEVKKKTEDYDPAQVEWVREALMAKGIKEILDN